MSNPYSIKNLVAETGKTEEEVRMILIDLRDDADRVQLISKHQYEAVLKALSGSSSLVLTEAKSEIEQREQQQIVATANELYNLNLTTSFEVDFIGFAQTLQARNQVLESIQNEADKQLAKNLQQGTQERFLAYQQAIESMGNYIAPDVTDVKESLSKASASWVKKLVR